MTKMPLSHGCIILVLKSYRYRTDTDLARYGMVPVLANHNPISLFTRFAFTPVVEGQSSPLPCEPLTGQQEALIRAGLEMPGLDWTVYNFNC
ncbi:unnamed protein product [Prunus armeniaca]